MKNVNKIILFSFLFFSSCAQPKIEEVSSSKECSRFTAEDYTYVSYKDEKPDMFLSSDSVSYDNNSSTFIMENIVSKLISGYNECSYILAKKGMYDLRKKTTTFFEKVKIVIEQKYVLEGTFFRWREKDSILETSKGTPVIIRDTSGLNITGDNFSLNADLKKFSLENVSMSLPESENEGF